eukprot:TRINITY_DN4554_c0_g2_i1.p1 TRINITY_DN4554_c0_g2~~TRINITY_DN4554_c0_g2_i1.p1  ORF type:complete len:157 (-),score=20.22 TRINITY_DN4554_c0_g2_i1:51-521(-)
MAMRCAALKAASLLRVRSHLLPHGRAFSAILDDLKYAQSHEWVKINGDTVVVGITDHAQHELGDVVFVDLPEVGASVTQGKPFGVVESVKAASDVYSPVSGEVVEVNSTLGDSPALVNHSPFEDGWIMKVKLSDNSGVESLLDAAKYKELTEKDSH